jgi:HEXXH motif-containing protein
MISGAESPERMLQVETLDAEFKHSYKEAGVRFYSAEEINDAHVLERLKEAITVLKSTPTLLATVAALVRSVHVLDPGDDDYDVSFSEPHIPFSIFVSVPQVSSMVSALRVAEAIVHEAMHLQLTLIEQVVPLVRTTSRQHYSPWRGEFRNARGVLHALYVFCVIDLLFCALQALPLRDSNVVDYIKRRRSEIRDQVSLIRSFQDSDDLTETGRAFTRRMITNLE